MGAWRYFEHREEVSMTEPKRKAGRPRKVVEEVNPDCEPATKGYVKCLLRKTRDHSHEQRVTESGCCTLVSAICWVYISLSWLWMCVSRGAYQWGTVHTVVFTIAVVCAILTLDRLGDNVVHTCCITQKEPEVIQPHCKKKKDCE